MSTTRIDERCKVHKSICEFFFSLTTLIVRRSLPLSLSPSLPLSLPLSTSLYVSGKKLEGVFFVSGYVFMLIKYLALFLVKRNINK